MFFLLLASYSSDLKIGPDPTITVISPVEGTEFESGAIVDININMTCECEMAKVIVKMFNTEGELDNNLMMSEELTTITSDLFNYKKQITLPTVNLETDILLEVEVLNEDGDDIESEQITIAVLPIQ